MTPPAMRPISFGLVVLGTVVGTLGGARLPDADLRVTAVGIALLIAGALGVRRTRLGQSAGAIHGSDASGDVLGMLRALPAKIDAIAELAPAGALSDLVGKLSALQRDVLEPLSERSPSLLPRLGGARFASIFGPYASAERALARAWSAAADQHRPEALASLRLAAERAREAAAMVGSDEVRAE
jgi:hypothetical protein